MTNKDLLTKIHNNRKQLSDNINRQLLLSEITKHGYVL